MALKLILYICIYMKAKAEMKSDTEQIDEIGVAVQSWL